MWDTVAWLIVGSGGLTVMVAQIRQLTRPARLRGRIEELAAARDALPEGSNTRVRLDRIIDERATELIKAVSPQPVMRSWRRSNGPVDFLIDLLPVVMTRFLPGLVVVMLLVALLGELVPSPVTIAANVIGGLTMLFLLLTFVLMWWGDVRRRHHDAR